MRDLTFSQESGSFDFNRYRYGSLSNTTVYSGVTKETWSARDDSHPSDGIRSTPYWAFEIESESNHFDIRRGDIDSGRRGYQRIGKFRLSPTNIRTSPHIAINGYNNPPVIPDVMVRKAHNLAIQKVQDSQLDAAMALAELRQTASLVLNTVTTALKVALAIRRGNWKRAYGLVTDGKSLPKGAANAYAATQWGWKPLISDVQAAITLMDRGLSRPDLVKIKAPVIDKVTTSSAGRPSTENEWTLGCEVGVTYRVRNPNLVIANSLGFLNPVYLLWQLIPLSFVIDWFISIGDWLRGLGGTIGLDFVTGYETRFAKLTNGLTTYDENRYTGSMPSSSTVAKSFQRTPLFDFPQTSLAITLDLNFSQFVSLVALLIQRT